MKQDEYIKLCMECNNILSKVKEGKAVPWLHVIKEHPEAIKLHEIIFNKSTLIVVISIILLALKNIISIFLTLSVGILKKGPNWYTNNLIKEVDVLLISHLISKNNVNKESDFYLGEMEITLRNSGIRVATAYIDHIGEATENKVKEFSFKQNIYLLPSYLRIREELIILKKVMKVLISFLEIKINSDFSRRILTYSILHSFSPSTFRAFRIQRQISKLLDQIKPKILLFTYEGHSWERLLAEETKSNERNIISIGYQHNLISKLQNASLQPLGFPYDPDFIFCSGPHGRQKFTQHSFKPRYGIKIIGSNRAPIKNIFKTIKNKENCILVIPEGLLSECLLLFEFSLKCAILYPSIQYIWRLHPAINLEFLYKNYPFLKEIPKNIILSNNSLENDINLSTCVLYRGSTAVIQALSKGLRPLYLGVPGEIPIDILYELKSWKVILFKPEDIQDLFFNRIHVTTFEESQAISYANFYYSPQSEIDIVTSFQRLLLKD
jgi:hypothetical protein